MLWKNILVGGWVKSRFKDCLQQSKIKTYLLQASDNICLDENVPTDGPDERASDLEELIPLSVVKKKRVKRKTRVKNAEFSEQTNRIDQEVWQ